jgi:uncharacterized protein YecE (DUF72 family)
VIRVGTAGWQIPRTVRERFPEAGSTLERYAAVFGCVEINTSFYRPHKPETWARWAASTPPGFRFSAKLPKAISHERKFADCAEILDRFLFEVSHLGEKLGPILVQTPAKQAFDRPAVESFLALLRARHSGPVVFEPRGPAWFEPEAEALFDAYRIGRVAADPPPLPAAAEPRPLDGLAYWRWHGSPRIYWSAYGAERLAALADRLGETAETWVVFDNTTSGAAAEDALALLERLHATA